MALSSRMPLRANILLLATLSLHLCAVADARLGLSRQPFLVRLWKEHARGPNGTATVGHPENHGRGYFVGALRLGSPEPQELHMIFSTTTGMVSLPSTSCTSTACTEHHRYSPSKSHTSVDIQQDGRPVDPAGGRRAPPGVQRDTATLGFYSTGKEATTGLEGVFVSEVVCLGDRLGNTGGAPQPVCAKAGLIVATEMQEAHFRSRPQDGMVGLSLKGQSINPRFNLLECLSTYGVRPQFGFWVSDDAGSAELVFGGHDQGRLESAPQWAPVATPEKGHWLVDIVGVHVGEKKLSICRSGLSCRGLIDTSSPGITIPEGMSTELLDLVRPKTTAGAGEEGRAAACSLPDLILELKDGLRLTLTVEDYAGPRCEPEIRTHRIDDTAVGAALFLLGEPLFRRYYTIFDWGKLQLGFGRAKVERSCRRLWAAGLPAEPGTCTGPVEPEEDEAVLLLEQDHRLLHFQHNLEN